LPGDVLSIEGLGIGRRRYLKHIAFQPIGKLPSPGFDASKAQDEPACWFIRVVHVGFYHWPPEDAIRMLDGSFRSLTCNACATCLRKNPPSELPRPTNTLPIPAYADKVLLLPTLDDPDSKAAQMPRAKIRCESRPCRAGSQWASIFRGGQRIGIELFV